MKELVEVITKALVDDPDGVAVTERQDGRTTVIEVRVADGDMGKVIGKQGRSPKAIRSVVKAAAAKEEKESLLTLCSNNRIEKGQLSRCGVTVLFFFREDRR